MKAFLIILGMVAICPSVALGVACFLLPITSIRRMKDMYGNDIMGMVSYQFFLHKFVQLEQYPKKGWSYIRFINLVSLFWIWGYILYLLGWVFCGLKKICPKSVKNYCSYVKSLFMTD